MNSQPRPEREGEGVLGAMVVTGVVVEVRGVVVVMGVGQGVMGVAAVRGVVVDR